MSEPAQSAMLLIVWLQNCSMCRAVGRHVPPMLVRATQMQVQLSDTFMNCSSKLCHTSLLRRTVKTHSRCRVRYAPVNVCLNLKQTRTTLYHLNPEALCCSSAFQVSCPTRTQKQAHRRSLEHLFSPGARQQESEQASLEAHPQSL